MQYGQLASTFARKANTLSEGEKPWRRQNESIRSGDRIHVPDWNDAVGSIKMQSAHLAHVME